MKIMLDDLIKERLKKLEVLKTAGVDPYPASAKPTHTAHELTQDFEKLAAAKTKMTVAGRAVGLRDQGSLIFIDLKDESGQIQLVAKRDLVAEFELFQKTLDIGDFIEADGILFTTQKGEKSIEVSRLKFLTKSLRPIPSEWYGLEDIETRLRKRYLDLLSHPELKSMFQKKALFWKSFRDFLNKNGFLEVETPVLEPIPGGADAEPFVTRHNALDTDFYLRISLELYQKRLIVAGFEKVFEIGRIFRNEGIDAEHLQDYTQMEFYWAYADYKDLMKFTEKMYKTVIKKTFGTLVIKSQGQEIDWGAKWGKLNYAAVFKKEHGMNLEKATEGQLLEKARELKLDAPAGLGKGRLIDLIFKKTIRPKIIQPTFLVNHPVDVSPLAKRQKPGAYTVQRLQVIALGTELGNGWSELNDPIDQRARFEEQAKLREKGDKEAQMMDEDFVEALEYGMPPTAGFGFSERLFAVLVDKPVRETVFFPPMRLKR